MTRNESQTQQPSSKKITKQKGKHGKANLPLEMDLLEQFFQIPEMPTRPIHNKGSGKQTEADEIDPTMIINVNEITLIDNIHPADNTSVMSQFIYPKFTPSLTISYSPSLLLPLFRQLKMRLSSEKSKRLSILTSRSMQRTKIHQNQFKDKAPSSKIWARKCQT